MNKKFQKAVIIIMLISLLGASAAMCIAYFLG